jgi:hypothetical protein
VVARHLTLNVAKVKACTLYGTREKQTPEALLKALEFMEDYLHEVDLIAGKGARYAYIEEPLMGRGGVRTTVKQAYVGGVVRALLVRHGFTVYGVHVSTWKAFHGVSSSQGTVAAKANVARIVKTVWPKVEGLVAGDGDLIDAAAICLYGIEQGRKAGLLVNDAGFAGSTVQRR